MYFLGLIDANGESKRRTYLVYNDEDSCCFMNPSATYLKEIMSNFGSVNVIIDQNDRHTINIKMASDIFSRHGFGSQ